MIKISIPTGAAIRRKTAKPTKMSSSVPVDPSLLDWADRWYTISWWLLAIAGIITAIGACATVVFFVLQWRTIKVRERQADWQIAQLGITAGQANERAANLEREAAVLRLELNREIQKHAQRLLTDEQKSAMILELKGKLSEILIVTQNDPEANLFKFQLLGAFSDAGVKIRVADPPRADKWYAPAGLLMYSPSGSTEEQLKDDPLYRALKRSNLFGGTMGGPFVSGQPDWPLPTIQGYNGPVLYIGQKPPF
jgi:hypothetical protein